MTKFEIDGKPRMIITACVAQSETTIIFISRFRSFTRVISSGVATRPWGGAAGVGAGTGGGETVVTAAGGALAVGETAGAALSSCSQVGESIVTICRYSDGSKQRGGC